MASSTIPNILQGLRIMLGLFFAELCAWWRWFWKSLCKPMMNMNWILLLLIFYSLLSTGRMIFLVSSVPFLPMLAGGSSAQKRWPRKSWCLFAHFHFFSHKDGNSSHGESDGALTEASGQPYLWYSGCFLMCSHSSFNLSSSFSVSSSLGLSFTLEPTLLGLSSS